MYNSDGIYYYITNLYNMQLLVMQHRTYLMFFSFLIYLSICWVMFLLSFYMSQYCIQGGELLVVFRQLSTDCSSISKSF